MYGKPEEFVHQWQALNPQWLSVAKLIQTFPQTEELPLHVGAHDAYCLQPDTMYTVITIKNNSDI